MDFQSSDWHPYMKRIHGKQVAREDKNDASRYQTPAERPEDATTFHLPPEDQTLRWGENASAV